MEGQDTKILGWTIAVALLVHWLVLQIALPPDSILSTQTAQNKKDDPILLEHYPESARKPVVQTSKATEQEEDSKEPAKYFGEFKNRVKKEVQSAIKGLFQEGERPSGEGGDGGSDSEDEFAERSGKAGKAGALGMRELMNFARSPQALPKEISEGTQTLLNTDKVLYASFMNRIADEIYQPWVRFGQDALHDVLSQGRKIEPNLFITKLLVTMNQYGEVTAMTVMKSSGIPELDEAPKKAFWKIARFPNPPSQLFDTDKFVRLTYEFQFEWKSSGFNIVPWAI